MDDRMLAGELVKIAERLVVLDDGSGREAAARAPSAVKRRVDVYMKKLVHKNGESYFEGYDDVFDAVQDYLFEDPDVPMDGDEPDLDVLNEWAFDLTAPWASELDVD